MLTVGRRKRADDPLQAYLDQPSPPLNQKAPSRKADLPPGPDMPLPISMLWAMCGFWYRRTPFLEQCRARYGTPFTFWMRIPPVPFVWFDDPDEVKAIFQGPADVLHCGNGSLELEHFFGRTGLTYMEEDEHLARRKVVMRSTHGEELTRINEAMREVAAQEVAAWPRDRLFDVWPYAHRLALKAIFQVCFGNDPDPRLRELMGVVEQMLEYNNNPRLGFLATQHVPEPLLRFLTTVQPHGFRRFFELRAEADRLIFDLVADRRRSGEAGEGLFAILLSSPAEDGEPIPARELRDEIMTTFLAGSASTASGISWGIERLAREHAVRERLVAELEAGEDDAYLTATVQEILRRKPPLTGVIPRTTMKPFEVNGRWYPPGVRLVPTAYLVHHNPSIYPDPYAFRPERFLDEPPGTFTWIPFGGGRRRCLGKAVGENEIKFVLRELLLRYELRPADQRPAPSTSHTVVMRPSQDARAFVAFTERSKQFAVTRA